MSALEKAWYNKARWPLLLTPLELFYRQLSRRDQAKKQAKQWQPPVPLIVVGNITVGGTGKSPLVCTLVRELKQRGWQPGIVSRGYGGKSANYPLLVNADSDPLQAGDEPVMLATQTACPVVVDPDRSSAAQHLLANSTCDLIISDDGLQHLSMGRDLELVVIDAKRGLGNGHCLPVGPLREPEERLQQVDYIFANGANKSVKLANVSAQAMSLQAIQWRQPLTGQCFPIADRPFTAQVKAVAGIGHPQRFFSSLESLGLTVQGQPFPDHHQFQEKDVETDNQPLLMTAKDAVKCRPWLNLNHWVLDVSAQVDLVIIDAIHQKLLDIKQRKNNG